MLRVDLSSTFNEEVERLSAGSKARAIAVAVHDFQSGLRFSLRGDRWFHAASTIKVAVLLAIFRAGDERSEEHTSELQSPMYLVCRLLLEKKKKQNTITYS